MPFRSAHRSSSLFEKPPHPTPPRSVADIALDPARREMEVRRRRAGNGGGRRSFRIAVLFHCGGPDMHPATLSGEQPDR